MNGEMEKASDGSFARTIRKTAEDEKLRLATHLEDGRNTFLHDDDPFFDVVT
jgi:hypothetical protein